MVKTFVNSVNFLYQRDYFPREAISQRTCLYKRLQTNKTYHQKDLVAHFGCVNAIDFSNDGKLMTSGGDDRRVLLWDVQESLHNIRNPSPKSMRAQHSSNIFTLAFDSQNKLIYSGGNDDHVIVHDVSTGDPLNFYLHERPVYGVSIDPSNDLIFASACDDGRVLVFDTRSSEEAVELAVNSGPFHAVMYNPCESRLVATANSKDGIALWDTRKPRELLMQYGSLESCMSIRFNRSGTQLLGLRRRLPPVLYNTQCSTAVAQFDHEGYYNSCTMKSCCFAGSEDEYVVSGSDDFVLYMWSVPRDDTYDQWIKSARHTLEGHRSIVNQVRYNEQNCILASSGVEKIVKLWSPFPLEPGPDEEEEDPEKAKKSPDSRKVYTHEDYIRLILRNGETFMNHDYSTQSTNEDPRMMAFFDSLVQREIEGWSPTDDSSSDMGGSSPRPFYSYVDNSPTSSSSSSCEEEATAESFRRRRGERRERGAEYFRRRRSATTETPFARSFRNRILEEGEVEEEETSTTSFRRNNNNNSTATPTTSNSNSTNSTSSSTNTSLTTSTNNSMILFLTDIVSESSDTSGLPERTRTIIGQSLAARFAAGTEDPPPSNTQVKNPIKELIAQKRERLMKLAFTPPEKRKRKHLKRLRRKTRDYTSDEITSPSGSDEDSTTRPTSSRSSQSRVRPRYRLPSTNGEDSTRGVNGDDNTRHINSNVEEAASTSNNSSLVASTSNNSNESVEATTGRKRKHSNSNSPESGISGETTETPDSGIVSDSRTSAVRFNKRLTSSLRSKARCYRNLVRVSSSSDDDDSD
uniref:DDB1- and CUL4-associated factor 5 n=1 Tax=Cacopsylla melanoneura TaxID=428564 RepID=A0A8D8YJK2_9HEMI